MAIRITKLITFLFGVVVLSALTYVYAQYDTTPENVAFTQNTNQSFLSAGQCIDGGRQVYGQYRLYQGDRTRPYDYHVKGNTTRYIDWFRFDAGKTNIELKNGTNNIFDVQGPFVIQSYGNPRNQGEVVLWTRNVVGMVAQNVPSSPTQIGAQLIYRLHRDGIDTQDNGAVSLPSFWYYPSLNVANPLESILGNNQYAQYAGIANRNVAGSVSGVECSNFYISRCGDGYIDSQSNNNHTIPLPSRSLANEVCDPGNPSQGMPAVIPAGQPAGTTCSTTCQLVPPLSSVITYTKTVRNVTTNSNSGQFVEADTQGTAVIVNPNDVVQYKITINKTGGPVVNTLLSDILPNNGGFIMTGYRINNGAIVAATSFPQTNITTQLNAGSVVVTLYGSVGPNPTASAFVNTANLTENGLPAPTLLPGSNVAWTKLPDVVLAPNIWITKEVETLNNSNNWVESQSVSPNQTLRFKITYGNNGNATATNVVVSDTLPAGLTCTNVIHANNTVIGCNTPNGFSYSVGNLPPGAQGVIYVTFTVDANVAPNNTIVNTATISADTLPTLSDPAQVIPTMPFFEITKTVLNGTFSSGAIITYRIEFKNTGTTPISSYRVLDILPSVLQYVSGTARLNNTITANPSITSNQLIWGCADGSYTALNGQTVCSLQPNAIGVITFDARVN